jgi:hypothetical protein
VVLTSAYGVNKLQNDGTCVLEERKYIEKWLLNDVMPAVRINYLKF